MCMRVFEYEVMYEFGSSLIISVSICKGVELCGCVRRCENVLIFKYVSVITNECK